RAWRGEPHATLLGRHRIAHHRRGVLGLRRPPSAESRERVIEGTPEEMHGAALAEESPLEPLHDPVGVGQHSKEAVGMPRIVRGMETILGERDRMINLYGHGPALHDDAEAGEDIRGLAVEVRDGPRT